LLQIYLKPFSQKFIVFIGVLLCTCSLPKVSIPFVMSENYRDANLASRPLVVLLPDTKNIVIHNQRDIYDDYGGVNATPQSRIEKFYLPLFIESIRANMSGDSLIIADAYQPEIALHKLETRKTVLKTDKDAPGLEYTLPTKLSMQSAGLDSAVLIIIDRLTFSRNDLYIEYNWDDKKKRPASLEVNAVVAIWDYKNDSPVFFGTVSQRTEFKLSMNRNHWDESAQMLGKNIILNAKCL
jgi:hypothetical protein